MSETAEPTRHETSAERQAKLLKADGFMCEAHPGLEFEHDPDCAGPGMPWMVEGKEAVEQLLGGRPQPQIVGASSLAEKAAREILEALNFDTSLELVLPNIQHAAAIIKRVVVDPLQAKIDQAEKETEAAWQIISGNEEKNAS